MPKHRNIIITEPTSAKSPAAAIRLKELYPKPYEQWLAFRDLFLTEVILREGGLTCHYCGQEGLIKDTNGLIRKFQATIDHVKPLSKGGSRYDKDNLVVACRPCNEKKGDKWNE